VTAALLFAALMAVWGVPGLMLSRWLLPGVGMLERVLTTALLGIVSVAPTAFLISVAFGVPETPVLITLVATLWTLAGWSLGRWLPCDAQEPVLDPVRSRRYLIGALVLSAVTALSTQYYMLQGDYVWFHCPHHASLYLMEDGTGGGVQSWDPAVDRVQTNLFHHPRDNGYGVGPVLKLQRPGSMAFLVQPFVWMSLGGLVAAMFIVDLLIFGFGMLLAARSLRSTWAPPVVGLLFLMGSRWLAVYQLNENMETLALSLGLLHLLLRPANGRFALASAAAAGVVAGHFLGIRPLGLLMVGGFMVMCATSWRRLGVGAGAGLCAVFPWMYVNAASFGTALAHPAVLRATEKQSLLGIEFTFHPLNWPWVANQIGRGPDDPFPVLIRLPLELIQAYGAPLIALVLIGLVAHKRPRRQTVGLLLWLLPVPLFLMAIVQLGAQKLSYMVMALAPMPFLIGAGAAALRDGTKQLRTAAAVCVAGLLLIPWLLQDLELPLDPRGHHTEFFSRSNDKLTLAEAPAANATYQAEERVRLTSPQLWPSLDASLDFTLSHHALGARLFSNALLAQRGQPDVPIKGPVVVWSAANAERRPMDHAFAMTTTSEAIDYEGKPGALGPAHGSGSGTLYAFRWSNPAPETVSVTLHRGDKQAANRMHVTLAPAGNTGDTVRYATFMVVDPSYQRVLAPELRIGKRLRTAHFVAEQILGKGQMHTEPRVVSNYAWAIFWEGGGIGRTPGKPQPLADIARWSDQCTTRSGGRLLRLCPDAHDDTIDPAQCQWSLLNRSDQLVAGRAAGASTVVAIGTRFPPVEAAGPCLARFLATRGHEAEFTRPGPEVPEGAEQ